MGRNFGADLKGQAELEAESEVAGKHMTPERCLVVAADAAL